MNLQRTGLFILAAVAAAAMLAASTIDAVPQHNAAAPPVHPLPYHHPANTPTDATWDNVFSANWR
jgi:hypothetical protein